MYRLPLLDTRSAVITVAIVPVGSPPNAVFVFLIAAITVPMVGSGRDCPYRGHGHPRWDRPRCDCSSCGRGCPSPPTLSLPPPPSPSPDKPPVEPTSSSKTNVRHPGDCPAVGVGAGCTLRLPLMLPPCSNRVLLTLPVNFHYLSLFLSHMHSHTGSRLRTKNHAQRSSCTTSVNE